MKKICVFAGSNPGTRPEYVAAARLLGKEMAGRGIGLVYGGSRIGLMGALADSVLAEGGEVTGVMPTGLFQGEMHHTNLTQFVEVETIHERKAKMTELSDGFIALPGGYGTLEELFEVISWFQIGIHSKPLGLLDSESFYQPLLAFLHEAVEAGFIPPTDIQLLSVDSSPASLIDQLINFERPAKVPKWSQL